MSAPSLRATAGTDHQADVVGGGQPATAGAPRGRGAGAVLAWVAALIALLLGTIRLGSTPALSTPPWTRPGQLADWASARGPVEAAFAVLRLAVGAGAAYLLAVTVLAVILRVPHGGSSASRTSSPRLWCATSRRGRSGSAWPA